MIWIVIVDLVMVLLSSLAVIPPDPIVRGVGEVPQTVSAPRTATATVEGVQAAAPPTVVRHLDAPGPRLPASAARTCSASDYYAVASWCQKASGARVSLP
jgi:hypothetical protein